MQNVERSVDWAHKPDERFFHAFLSDLSVSLVHGIHGFHRHMQTSTHPMPLKGHRAHDDLFHGLKLGISTMLSLSKAARLR